MTEPARKIGFRAGMAVLTGRYLDEMPRKDWQGWLGRRQRALAQFPFLHPDWNWDKILAWSERANPTLYMMVQGNHKKHGDSVAVIRNGHLIVGEPIKHGSWIIYVVVSLGKLE